MSLDSQTASTVVHSLYVSYFGRAADGVGFYYWFNRLLNGEMTVLEVSAAFARSDEFISSFAEMPGASTAASQRLVDALYTNLLNSSPDDAGGRYWLNKIEATGGDATSIGLIVVQFFDATQFVDSLGDMNHALTAGVKVATSMDFLSDIFAAGYTGSTADGRLDPRFLAIAQDVVDEEVGFATGKGDSHQETLDFIKLLGIQADAHSV